jgi:DNA invertase Pin-like site-specific DNA recombinase
MNEFVNFVSNLNIVNHSPRKSNQRKRHCSHSVNKYKNKKSKSTSVRSTPTKSTSIRSTSIRSISTNSTSTNSTPTKSTPTNSTPTDTIIYARCSTLRQERDNLQSLTTQAGLCLDYCIQNELNVVKIIKEIYNGHDMTKLQINSIPEEFSNINIIIADPSRMSRNVSDADIFINKCKQQNIKLHFVRDNLVTNSNSDYKKIIDLVCDASIESKTMSKRLKTAFDIRKKYGSHIGSAPYGYEIQSIIDPNINLKIRKLAKKQSEQDIIELVNRLYFGSDLKDFYKIFRKVTNNNKFRLLDVSNNEFNAIYYGNIRESDIVDLLNENNIYKRDILWTTSSLTKLLSETEDFNVKYLNESDLDNEDQKMSCDE